MKDIYEVCMKCIKLIDMIEIRSVKLFLDYLPCPTCNHTQQLCNSALAHLGVHLYLYSCMRDQKFLKTVTYILCYFCMGPHCGCKLLAFYFYFRVEIQKKTFLDKTLIDLSDSLHKSMKRFIYLFMYLFVRHIYLLLIFN